MWPAPAAKIAARTASAFSGGTKITHLSRFLTRRGGLQNRLDGQPERVRQRIGHTWRRRVGVGVRGEQRTPRTDQAVHQAHPWRCSAATVSTPRSSSGWCASSRPPSGTASTTAAVASTAMVTELSGVVGVTADQTDRIPRLREPGRVRLVQRLDDRAQPNRHRTTPLSAIASTSTGHSGRTAARRYCPSKPTKVSHRRTAIPLVCRCFRINAASPTVNNTNGATPSTGLDAGRPQAGHHLGPHRRQPPRARLGFGYRLGRTARGDGGQLQACPSASAAGWRSAAPARSGAPSA